MTRRKDSEGRIRPARAVWRRYSDPILGTSALFILALGTVMYHWLEGWSWIDSLYFSSVAVTTVGFGDLAPSTDVSKLFTVLYIFSGVAIIATFLNTRLQRRAERVNQQRSSAPNPPPASGGTQDVNHDDASGNGPKMASP